MGQKHQSEKQSGVQARNVERPQPTMTPKPPIMKQQHSYYALTIGTSGGKMIYR